MKRICKERTESGVLCGRRATHEPVVLLALVKRQAARVVFEDRPVCGQCGARLKVGDLMTDTIRARAVGQVLRSGAIVAGPEAVELKRLRQ